MYRSDSPGTLIRAQKGPCTHLTQSLLCRKVIMHNLALSFSWGTLMRRACPYRVTISPERLAPEILRFAAQGMEAFMASPEYSSTVRDVGVSNAGSVTPTAVSNMAADRVKGGVPNKKLAKILSSRPYTFEVIALVAARALDALPAEERIDVAGGALPQVQRAGRPCLPCAVEFDCSVVESPNTGQRRPLCTVWA